MNPETYHIGGIAYSQEFVERAVNCHEELVQAVKDLLSRGAHGDEWRTASEKRAMQAIANTEGK